MPQLMSQYQAGHGEFESDAYGRRRVITGRYTWTVSRLVTRTDAVATELSQRTLPKTV